MSYIVQASPLSKIYMREWQEKCVKDPTLIIASSPGLFDMRIKRPAGGIVLSHLKPVHAATLIKRTGLRKIEEDETTPLVNWLTENEETEPFGVVAINVGDQFEAALQDILALAMDGDQAAAEKKQATIKKDIVKTMSKQLVEAREKADARVKHAMSMTHNNLIASWERLRTQGGDTYAPSACEAMGYYVLKEVIDERMAVNRQLYDTVAAGMPGSSRRGG